MIEKTFKGDRFNWRLPSYVVGSASIVLLSLMVWSPNGDLLYIFLIAPFTFLVLLISFLRNKVRLRLSMIFTLVVFLCLSGVLLKNEAALRPSLRWLLWSHRLKGEVLAQTAPAVGELSHLEWDGWGGAPVGDWTAYIVFDPTDSLSAAAKNRSYGRFSGVPCDVNRVRRLESHWYSVELEVNEWWDSCH